MHPLRLSIFLSLHLIYFTSVSMPLNSVAHDGGATDTNISDCNSVPYPFGALGVALNGFEVVCTSTTTGNRTKNHKPFGNSTQDNLQNPSLQLPTGTYLIQNISLHGQVRILTGLIYHQCYDNGTEMLTRGTGWLNLTGTPFTLSRNDTTFVAIGCDDVVRIDGDVEDGNIGGKNFSSGCVAFCSSSSSIIDGSCSGLGCCQMPLPGPGGLKSFELNLYRINQNTGVNILTNCSAAFFTTRDEFSFKKAYFGSYFGTQAAASYVVVLNWAIGDKSCEEAKEDVTSFACKENSQCYDSQNSAGYLCNCTQGYEGNPYAQGGCTDIDECQYGGLNPCSESGHCINTPGSVKCGCPPDMSGDGRKDGSGCSKMSKKTSQPNVILGICLGLVFILAMASVGLCLVIILFALVLWTYWLLKKRRVARRKQRYFFQNGGFMLRQQISSQKAPAKIFSSEELEKASNNYSTDRIVGQGGYGTVYKGILADHTVVAIKKSKLVDQTQIEQFINEVVILSQIDHRNVVKLLGCCLETEVPLLVYEFIPKGNLFYHLHKDQLGSISWENRLRIAVETATALAHLHSATKFPIIHRDVKSSNILLDENYTVKVSDFGASRLVPFNQTHVTTLVQGTLGYLDPEYFETSVLTEKSDVYSFGVVLVELLTREMPVSHSSSEEWKNLAARFTTLVECNQFLEIVDYTVLKEAGVRHLNVVTQIALNCLSLRREDRPKMVDVLVELNALRRLLKQQMIDRTQEEEHLVLCPKGTTLYEGSSSNLIELD